MRSTERQHPEMLEVPNGNCPNHSTGLRLPDDIVVTQLQYLDRTL